MLNGLQDGHVDRLHSGNERKSKKNTSAKIRHKCKVIGDLMTDIELKIKSLKNKEKYALLMAPKKPNYLSEFFPNSRIILQKIIMISDLSFQLPRNNKDEYLFFKVAKIQ